MKHYKTMYLNKEECVLTTKNFFHNELLYKNLHSLFFVLSQFQTKSRKVWTQIFDIFRGFLLLHENITWQIFKSMAIVNFIIKCVWLLSNWQILQCDFIGQISIFWLLGVLIFCNKQITLEQMVNFWYQYLLSKSKLTLLIASLSWDPTFHFVGTD